MFELGVFFLWKVHPGKVANDRTFSSLKTKQNPRWGASMPRAVFSRIMERVKALYKNAGLVTNPTTPSSFDSEPASVSGQRHPPNRWGWGLTEFRKVKHWAPAHIQLIQLS